ncbi:TerC family protein [Chelativorans intermedius]|uniref:TerC family protein n=1 Tax=Chelativorans intermedius TaxID=515947 RepID=A0ABV6D5C9_9HYPH|nr:TerC family protein [Chelativorans intermedius]MCT8997109.1 TerC family protein [Chelativorans intermedius]
MTLHDWLWPGFLAFVATILFVDLFVLHRRDSVISMTGACRTVAAYVTLAMLFAAGVFFFAGAGRGAEFLTGYLIEQALSLDNIFVIALIFAYFKVPAEAQYRVLFYGIVGAIVMRLSLIVPGVKLVDQFHVVAMALGGLLIFSGFKMLTSGDEMVDPGDSRIVRLLMRSGRVTPDYEGSKFFIRRDGLLYMTPLFVVLVTVEITDLIFAIDSIPAVLAVSNDAFIVFSSNVFAILGLRALFFVLSGMMRAFRYLKTGLSLVLVFIGLKMLFAEYVEIPSMLALSITALIIGGSVVASLLHREAAPEGEAAPQRAPEHSESER